MSGIGAIVPANALRIVRPVHQSAGGHDFRDGQKPAARTAYASTRPTGSAASRTGHYGPFVAQAIANDNMCATAPSQTAIAYIVARDRMTDLPVGFLISRAV